MTAAQHHGMDLDHWMSNGGQWCDGGMMGGSHDGHPVGTIDDHWKHGSHYGMMFTSGTT